MLLEVLDDGVGIEANKLKSLINMELNFDSVGLNNVNKRLINLYGEEYSLKISSKQNEGTSVLIRIPYEKNQHFSEMKEVVA